MSAIHTNRLTTGHLLQQLFQLEAFFGGTGISNREPLPQVFSLVARASVRIKKRGSFGG
jgi:hypothetical protein